MTKKHFIAIAKILDTHGQKLKAIKKTLLHESLCKDMVEMLQNYNKNFDKEKFLKASGAISFDETNK